MKNIHVLPTDKPSRLYLNTQEYIFEEECSLSTDKCQNKHIYITSDEEIKEGDWFIHSSHGTTTLLKCKSIHLKEIIDNEGKNCWLEYSHKIILTTDQDLIKDGIQAIDDEFLEWFVKNPSCEKVDFNSIPRCCGRCNGEDDLCYSDMTCDNHKERGCEICYGKKVEYQIIIPKEEPKPFKQMEKITEVDWQKFKKNPIPSKKEETLEEAAEKFAKKFGIEIDSTRYYAFINGAKWQSERMYSEEELLDALKDYDREFKIDTFSYTKPCSFTIEEWFEQFKNK